MKNRMMLGLAAAGILGIAVAVGAKEEKSNRPDRKPGTERKPREQVQTRANQIKDYLLEKYPEEMKEIEEAQKQLMEKRRALHKKAMEEMSEEDREGLGIGSRRKAAVNRRAAMYAKEKYPEEFKEIMELRKDDSQGAAEKMKNLLDKSAKEMPADWKPEEGGQKRQIKGEEQKRQRRGDAQKSQKK